jgi:hypothetical protein
LFCVAVAMKPFDGTSVDFSLDGEEAVTVTNVNSRLIARRGSNHLINDSDHHHHHGGHPHAPSHDTTETHTTHINDNDDGRSGYLTANQSSFTVTGGSLSKCGGLRLTMILVFILFLALVVVLKVPFTSSWSSHSISLPVATPHVTCGVGDHWISITTTSYMECRCQPGYSPSSPGLCSRM